MAQGTYTVSSEPEQGRSYPNKNGPKDAEGNPTTNLTVWRLGLEGVESDADDNLFELHKKEGGRPPGVGDTIEVERFFPGEFSGVKFTRIRQVYNAAPGSGGPGGGGGGSSAPRSSDGPGLKWKSAPFERGAEHPRNEARAIHTSSLASTPAYLNSLLAFGAVDGDTLKPTDKWDAYWKLVGKVATKLTRSYEAAMEPQQQQQLPVDAAAQGGAQEVPADTDGLVPAAAGASDDVPF